MGTDGSFLFPFLSSSLQPPPDPPDSAPPTQSHTRRAVMKIVRLECLAVAECPSLGPRRSPRCPNSAPFWRFYLAPIFCSRRGLWFENCKHLALMRLFVFFKMWNPASGRITAFVQAKMAFRRSVCICVCMCAASTCSCESTLSHGGIHFFFFCTQSS